MFSRDELIRCAHPPGDDADAPLMDVAEFHRHQFRVPIQGHRIAHRGGKDNFASALEFWLWSLQLTDRPTTSKGFRRFAEEALCQPISERTFFEIIDCDLLHLKRPPPEFLTQYQMFVSGLKMYGGVVLADYRSSVLAEFSDCYVAFHSRILL